MGARLPSLLKSLAFLLACLFVALAVLGMTSWFVAASIALVSGNEIHTIQNLSVGLVCGLITWLFVFVFHLGKETVKLRVSDVEKFQARLRKIMEDMGFRWVPLTESHWKARPEFRSLILGGSVSIQIEGGTAKLTGPHLTLDRIKRRYRLASQMDKVQESIHDSKHRIPECYVKRLQLSLRLDPEGLREFQTRVVDVLEKSGEVVLDVQLMVVSDEGIREAVWSQQVRPWLEDAGVHYEFHKDHPQRISPAAPAALAADSLIDTCLWT